MQIPVNLIDMSVVVDQHIVDKYLALKPDCICHFLYYNFDRPYNPVVSSIVLDHDDTVGPYYPVGYSAVDLGTPLTDLFPYASHVRDKLALHDCLGHVLASIVFYEGKYRYKFMFMMSMALYDKSKDYGNYKSIPVGLSYLLDKDNDKKIDHKMQDFKSQSHETQYSLLSNLIHTFDCEKIPAKRWHLSQWIHDMAQQLATHGYEVCHLLRGEHIGLPDYKRVEARIVNNSVVFRGLEMSIEA